MVTARVTPPLLLAGALGLGLAADGLLRAPVWGLNVTLGIAVLVAWGIQAQRLAGSAALARSVWPWVGATAFGAMWALRDEPLLLAADLLAALTLLSLPLLAARGVPMAVAGVVDLVRSPLLAAREAVVGGARTLLEDVPWGSVTGRHRSTLQGTVIGLALAVPIVVVFGALFAAADPTFEAAVSLIPENLGTAVGHVVLTAAGAWLSAGYLRGFLTGGRRPLASMPAVAVGLPPVVIALGAMVLVFTLFLAVQSGNLFRGEVWVRDRVGLTYAEYARGGFFQLVAASLLALPIVYGATFAAGSLTDAASRSLHALQAVALGLVSAVAASALWRMGLYVGAYGLTVDRLYGTAVILWIGGAIGVLARTILAGRPAGVARGIVIAAVVVLGLLNAVSPVALIARVNLGRSGERAPDLVHIASLSADAVPTIADRLRSLSPTEQCTVAGRLTERWRAATHADWRGWNLARARARARIPELERIAAACPPPPAAPGSAI